ncbi:MAG: hypothetical protein M3250_06465 [Thermoproteota archaeon]|jgi:hypothetical protein|nr:hypothetical protein [Thermoproteota archaeon]
MNTTSKVITLALTLGLFFVLSVSNLISIFGETLGGTSASSVNDYGNDNTTSQRLGNTTDTIPGGLSASSVGNSSIMSNRTGNTTNTIPGGLSASSVRNGANTNNIK